MLNRRTLLSLAAAMSFMPPARAGATEIEFSEQTFAAAQKDGKRILVDVWASWCPTCKAQGPLLKSQLAKPENQDVVLLRVNFDTQLDVLKALRVQQQSTLIMFKGDKETSRTVGDTSDDGIAQLIASAK